MIRPYPSSEPTALLAATALLFVACSAARPVPPASTPPHTEPAPVFLPRLVPQVPLLNAAAFETERSGDRRVVFAVGREVAISDPRSGTFFARETIPGLDFTVVDLSPTFQTLCVGLDQGRVGAYDLGARRLAWSASIADGEQAIRVIATARECAFTTWRDGAARVVRFSLDTGQPVPDIPGGRLIAPFEGRGALGTRILWSTDGARRYQLRLERGARGVAWMSDRRDASTLVRSEAFWAACVEARPEGEAIGLSAVEPQARREWFRRNFPASWIDCPEPTADAWKDEAHRGSGVVGVLPSPWVLFPDGRVLHHDEAGLYLWEWKATGPGSAALPRLVSPAPVPTYRDVNADTHPLTPVVAADGSWFGAIDKEGTLARWSSSDASPLSPVSLPRGTAVDSPAEAHWQVFTGAGDRIAVVRDVARRRTLFLGSVAQVTWTRSDARLFPYLLQDVRHEPGRAAWLVSEPHWGLLRVDERTGRVGARFDLPDTLSRASHAVPSPDGASLALVVGVWPGDQFDGFYVLDATTLAPRAHFREDRGLTSGGTVLEWDGQGVLLGAQLGQLSEFAWWRLDAATGAATSLGRGTKRWMFGHGSAGTRHLFPDTDGAALVASPLNQTPVKIGIQGGGGFVEDGGRVRCSGAACQRYRCVTSPTTAAAFDDPACVEH